MVMPHLGVIARPQQRRSHPRVVWAARVSEQVSGPGKIWLTFSVKLADPLFLAQVSATISEGVRSPGRRRSRRVQGDRSEIGKPFQNGMGKAGWWNEDLRCG